MKRNELIKLYLNNGFLVEQGCAEIDFLCSILFNLSQKELILSDNLPNEAEKIVMERIKTQKPIQQIVGKSYFLEREFFVNSSTLIPRPETELLVLRVLDIMKKAKLTTLLDIGTGTGCIPISILLENKDVKATCVDISQEALNVAKKNAEALKVSKRIKFLLSDLFQNISGKFDVIVSNPPYISPKMYEELEDEVKNFEPKTALLAKDQEGVEFYEKITSQAKQFLNAGGYLAFEIGFNQGEIVKNIFQKYEYINITLEKDLDNKDRIVFAQKP